MNPIEPSIDLNTPHVEHRPDAGYDTYPIEFTGSGSEYFRVWIVNLLLILVTLGVYLPWAKVRKIKYFYSNTLIDGHALDFHGNPKKMLRGTALVAVFFLLYSKAFAVSPWAALVASVAIIALWPVLFRASMRFRLSNTSWRSLRFEFSGDLKESFFTIGLPLALILMPICALALYAQGLDLKASPQAGEKLGFLNLALMGAYMLIAPYFVWRTATYQHNHYNFSTLRTELRCKPWDVYSIFLKTLGAVVLMAFIVGIALAIFTGFSLKSLLSGGAGGAIGKLAFGVLFFAIVAMAFNAGIRSYWITRMQNLLWTRTGNSSIRFISDLKLGAFAWQQFKNYLLIFITLGFYWPFAVIATKRMQLEAMSLRSRVDFNALVAQSRSEGDAAGDAAADMFNADLGL
jgi:uncharacterized membrane protein YjgN (DUF898 family)